MIKSSARIKEEEEERDTVLCPRSDDDDLRVIKRLAVTAAAAAANSNCIRRPGWDLASPPFIIQPKGRGITRKKKAQSQTYGVTVNLHNHEGAVAGSAPKGKKKAD